MLDENLSETVESDGLKDLKRKCDEMSPSSQDLSKNEDQNALGDNGVTSEPPEKKLSKNEQKRLRRREAWLAHRSEKRAKERERLKAKRQEAKLKNIDLGPSRKILKHKTMANSSCKIHVAVDMSFDDYMVERDLSKCLKQLLHCYTLNRRADNPMQLSFTSFSGKCKTHMEKHNGYDNWDVNFKEDYITDVFPKEKLVYLTSDSSNTILTLQEDKVYIIGGLVDHNVHKGLCHKIAEEKGISHAQLPIENFFKMSSRKVLTIDHVFEILLNVSCGLSWEEAFLKVIPKRKGVLPIKNEGTKDKVTIEAENTIEKNSDEAENSAKSENILEKTLDAVEDSVKTENTVEKNSNKDGESVGKKSDNGEDTNKKDSGGDIEDYTEMKVNGNIA